MSSIVSEEQESGSSSSSSSAAAHEDGPTVLEDEIFGSDLDESEEGSQLAGRRSDEEGSGREGTCPSTHWRADWVGRRRQNQGADPESIKERPKASKGWQQSIRQSHGGSPRL